MTVKSTWKRLAAGATGLALVLGLSACSAQPGVALNVNGVTYTEDEVSQAADQISELSGQTFPLAGVAYMLAQEPALREVANANGIDFSEADARKAMASVEEQTGVPVSDAAVTVVRANQLYYLLSQSLNPEVAIAMIQESMADMDIEYNPRYGELGADNGIFSPQLEGVLDLSEQQ